MHNERVSYTEFLGFSHRNGSGFFVFILGCDIYSSNQEEWGEKSSEITRVGFQVKG